MLKDEIVPYLDSEQLVAPLKGGSSNNGVMYTSEYIIMLIRNKEATSADLVTYMMDVQNCMKEPGLLGRHKGGVGDQEGPDDYLGLAAALDEICWVPQETSFDRFNNKRAKDMARSIVLYSIKHLGDMNNVNPNAWSWGAFLGRQPQLAAAFLWAARLPVNPLLSLYVALVILFGDRGKPKDDTDPRRLSWLLVQVAQRHSLFGKWAAKVWYRRLHKIYPNGMKDVAAIYYEKGHPFSKYWSE